MTPGSGNGLAFGVDSPPMLLECDRRGQVIWVSERIRSTVGTPQTLFEIFTLRGPSPPYRFSISPVWEARDTLLIALEIEEMAARPAPQAYGILRNLEARILEAYFRLQHFERRLFTSRMRRRRGGGRMALRQIEVERRRLAGELHTGVGQMLAAIRLQLELVANQLPEPPAQVRQALENIAALAEDALSQVRSVSRRLHPPEWQRLTIEAALRQLWTVTGIPLSFQAELDLPDLGREPEPEVKALIYRTAQEGLSNIIGHSKAATVRLSMRRHGDLVRLVLEDNGVGFDPAELKRAPSSLSAGIGLRSLTEQAQALGAKIDIESGTNGTKLILSTPFSVNPEL